MAPPSPYPPPRASTSGASCRSSGTWSQTSATWPEWLSHVNANVLKVKLAMAIVGISSIHLLQTFINASNHSSETMLWQTVIHLTFVASAVSLALIDRYLSPKNHPEGALEGSDSHRDGVGERAAVSTR